MDLSRRSFLSGLVAVVAAPAVIRTPGLLMPTKQRLVMPSLVYVEFVLDRTFAKWRQVTFDAATHFPVLDPLGVLAPVKHGDPLPVKYPGYSEALVYAA
jgi:hypothetical protein